MTVSMDAQIEEWRGKLLDTTKKNALVSLKLGKSGAVKLVHPSADELWARLVDEGESVSFPEKHALVEGLSEDVTEGHSEESLPAPDAKTEDEGQPNHVDIQTCLLSPRLLPDHVLTELTDKQLKDRLGRFDRNAGTSLTEQGVPILYVAFGLLKRHESPDSNEHMLSPLLLFPAELKRENIDSPWTLKLTEEEPVPNHSLAQLMKGNFQIQLPELPDQAAGENGSSFERHLYYAGIQHVIRHQKRWEILDECALGVFPFQKIAMWKDLEENKDQIASHDLCRAIARDPSIPMTNPGGMPAAKDLDTAVRPIETYHILDADSSQHEAIEAAKRGVSLVLDGPPGTGKSQTIANIIAECLAVGKTVLFVSEKLAALEVVKQRLDNRGLGDFCLECHSHKSNKKSVIDELGSSLNLDPVTYKDHSEVLNRLYETRKTLNDYVQSLHEPRQPLGLSAFQVHGRYAAAKAVVSTGYSIPEDVVSTMTQSRLRQFQELLDGLPDCRDTIRDHARHPWRGIKSQKSWLNLKADIDHHLAELDAALGRIQTASATLSDLGLAPDDLSVPTWLGLLEELKEIPLVPSEWFQDDPRRVASAYIELDKQTSAYRLCRDELPEFSEEALSRLDGDVLKALKGFSSHPDIALLPHARTTVLGLRSHLQAAETPLETVTSRARELNQALGDVLAILGWKPCPFAARGIGKVQELLGKVGKVSPIRGFWLEPERRREIQKIIERCREDEARNREARLGLIDRMLPSAFDPNSGDMIRRARAYGSPWKL